MTLAAEPRKYSVMSDIPGDLVTDVLAYTSMIVYQRGQWLRAIQREGCVAVGSDPVHYLSDPVEMVYDNYEGHGRIWRLFHRHRVTRSVMHTLGTVGYCVPVTGATS